MRPTFKCIAAVAGGLLAGFILFSLADNPIQSAPVYVRVRTNPPPQIVALLGSNTIYSVSVPLAQVNQPPVTDADVLKIKRAIPWSKTVGRLYLPSEIEITSSSEAEAHFWRRRKPMTVTLVKTGEVWRIEWIGSGGHVDSATPPGVLDGISNALPF
jgi:hypothetical protein